MNCEQPSSIEVYCPARSLKSDAARSIHMVKTKLGGIVCYDVINCMFQNHKLMLFI